MNSPSGPPNEPSTTQATSDDHELAHRLATEAGDLLVRLREQLVAAGASGDELKAEGDRQANAWLMAELRAARPDDPVLSEEQTEAPGALATRLGSTRAWIVDPLDGTREFSEPPRSDWAVHVALAIDGVAIVGAVALPAIGETLSTFRMLTEPIAQRESHNPPRIVISRTRPPAEALAIAETLEATLINMGSAGAKAMSIVRNEADLYPHSGGQFEWDSCAPVAVALAAGLWCSRLDGTPLRYNQQDPYLPDLLICTPDVADRALEIAASCKDEKFHD